MNDAPLDLDTATNLEIAEANLTAEMVWSAAYEKIVASVKGFATYRRTPALTIQPQDLPCLSVYLLRDAEQPIGDYNILDPRFYQRATLGISGMILASNVDDQLAMLATKLMATRLALYTDPAFVRLTSGFESSDTKLVFSRVGELAVAEYQMQLVMCWETVWPPYVPDDFLRLHLETAFPEPDTMDAVQQVTAAWDIDPETGELTNAKPEGPWAQMVKTVKSFFGAKEKR
jgi:hypothetical protein